MKRVPHEDKKLSRNDAATIIEDIGRIPDRDRSFSIDKKQIHNPDIIAGGWAGSVEESERADRSPLDMGDAIEVTPAHTPTRVARMDDDEDEFVTLDEDDLHERAEILGIAGRSSMNRRELIEAIQVASSPLH